MAIVSSPYSNWLNHEPLPHTTSIQKRMPGGFAKIGSIPLCATRLLVARQNGLLQNSSNSILVTFAVASIWLSLE